MGWTTNSQIIPGEPLGGPVSRYEVFAPVGPKQVHHRGWAGFGLKTGEGVHREGGRGEGKPSPKGSNTPTKVDGFLLILMVIFGLFWAYFLGFFAFWGAIWYVGP